MTTNSITCIPTLPLQEMANLETPQDRQDPSVAASFISSAIEEDIKIARRLLTTNHIHIQAYEYEYSLRQWIYFQLIKLYYSACQSESTYEAIKSLMMHLTTIASMQDSLIKEELMNFLKKESKKEIFENKKPLFCILIQLSSRFSIFDKKISFLVGSKQQACPTQSLIQGWSFDLEKLIHLYQIVIQQLSSKISNMWKEEKASLLQVIDRAPVNQRGMRKNKCTVAKNTSFLKISKLPIAQHMHDSMHVKDKLEKTWEIGEHKNDKRAQQLMDQLKAFQGIEEFSHANAEKFRHWIYEFNLYQKFSLLFLKRGEQSFSQYLSSQDSTKQTFRPNSMEDLAGRCKVKMKEKCSQIKDFKGRVEQLLFVFNASIDTVVAAAITQTDSGTGNYRTKVKGLLNKFIVSIENLDSENIKNERDIQAMMEEVQSIHSKANTNVILCESLWKTINQTNSCFEDLIQCCQVAQSFWTCSMPLFKLLFDQLPSSSALESNEEWTWLAASDQHEQIAQLLGSNKEEEEEEMRSSPHTNLDCHLVEFDQKEACLPPLNQISVPYVPIQEPIEYKATSIPTLIRDLTDVFTSLFQDVYLPQLHSHSTPSWQKKLLNIYMEVKDHIFLAGCGLEIGHQVLKTGHLEGLGVIFPMLLLDWHSQIEQLLSIEYVKKYGELATSHSLVELSQLCEKWKKLPVDLQKHMQGINYGLIWSRYPSSSLNYYQRSEMPSGLKCLKLSQQLLKKIAKGEFTLNPEWMVKIESLFKDMIKAHCYTIEVMLHFLNGSNTQPRIQLIRNMMTSLQAAPIELNLLQNRQTFSNQMKHSSKRDVLEPLFRSIANIEEKQIRMNHSIFPLKDAHQHLRRLCIAFRMINQPLPPHLEAWYSRNLMNVQWIFEGLYVSQCLSYDLGFILGHDFKVFREIITDYKAILGIYESDVDLHKKIKEYNFSKVIHYPRQCPGRPFVAEYIHSIDYSRQQCGVPEGFRRSKTLVSQSFLTIMQTFIENGLSYIEKHVKETLADLREKQKDEVLIRV